MLLFASTSDRRLRETIREWKRIAIDTIRGLEGWRDEPELYFEDHAEYNGEREAIVLLFRACTTELIQEANNLGLSPRPIQEFFEAVSAWNHEHSADHVPDQRRLSAMFDSALMILDTVEEEIRQRAIKKRAESGNGKIAPVVTNGRHTSNSTLSVEPVTTKTHDQDVIPTYYQKLMLVALEGRALRTGDWVKRSGVSKRTLMKLKKELQARGLVKHVARLGFFRPDAPPPGLAGT